MTAYAVAMLRITDADKIAEYRTRAADALAQHGGEVVHAAPGPKVLEGQPIVPDIMALLRFADAAAAEAWIGDPALADVHALRRGIVGYPAVLRRLSRDRWQGWMRRYHPAHSCGFDVRVY